MNYQHEACGALYSEARAMLYAAVCHQKTPVYCMLPTI